MTEIAQLPSDTAQLEPRQLLAPSLSALLQELALLLPPASAAQAIQARQILQQMDQAIQVLQLPSLSQLLQAMDPPLQALALHGEALPDKAGELLQLATHDAQRFVHALGLGQPSHAQELFGSYRALCKLSGKDTAHPADLWDHPWPSPCLPAPEHSSATPPSTELRTQLDQHVLALLQTGNPAFCTTLQQLCHGLSAHAQDATTWQLAATWLEALEFGLLDMDIYAKRTASRLLAYYASYAKGEQAPPAMLARDLLFFCAQAAAHAQQQRQALPPLLGTLHAHCHPVADSMPTPSAAPLNARVRDTPPAPALPAFQNALEIQPAEPLVQGLATTPQHEPETEFLQAAEALSQQLVSGLGSTAQQPPAASAPAALAADAAELSRLSWAAGCADIAALSHQLQRCLQRMDASASSAQRRTCLHAAEEIRRLLHQFAAGFMRRAHPQVTEALHQLFAQLPEPRIELTPAVPEVDGEACSTPEDASALPSAEAACATNTGTDSAEATCTSAMHTPNALEAPVTAHPADTHSVDTETEAAPFTVTPLPAAPTDNATAPRAPSPPALDAMHFSVFEEETLSLWPKLQGALKHWVKQPQDPTVRQIVLRCLHTLKGSARLAAAMAWASQVHALEGLALEVSLQEDARGPACLLAPVEALRIAFVALQQEMDKRYPERQASRLQLQPLEAVERHAQALWHSQDKGQQALAASQLSTQEIASSLQQLRAQIQDCAAWADTLMLHGDADLPYEWHEELHELVRALNDCTDDLGTAQQQLQQGLGDIQLALGSQANHLRALQHTLLYTRLRPFSHLQARLSACVQQAAEDCGKTVDLFWQGADTAMECDVQDALTPALEHVLRNCVVHGIEPPAQRQTAQKPSTGKILLRLHTDGLRQVLSLLDDGAGLDTEAIRHKALHLGLVQPDEAVDPARAAQLILHPGLSTAAQVNELAGRGIGMDAVADTITQLGGSLHISSTPGKGCRFDITLPAPPQVEQVLALRAGSWRVAIPARCVEAVRRLPCDTADHALSQGLLAEPGQAPLPLHWAGAAWQQSTRSLEMPLDGQRHLLIVRGDTARWGLICDELLGTQEVILQPPTQLHVPVPGLLGTAALPSGHVLQVYEPAAVLMAHEARLLQQPASAAPPPPELHEPERPLVLLADDSMSVRRLAQHLLHSHGYRMALATDGLEALQLLEAGSQPSLLIADVEMPNMDGMELLRRVRSDARWQSLPVLMLTAHTAGPVSQKAIALGAQAFLTKPYAPHELLAQVRRYSQPTDNAS